ncbi:MAG TPA: response regulator [Rugosimonospora sp.]|nr:response regulator [Rugosimonospora sp.]
MIRTLVVDDDYRVARIHAASVERVPGFACVGQAHTAAEARSAIAEHQPDLLLLDIYLPDEDGLSLLRSLRAQPSAPDCIIISAARDLRMVRSAMQVGAVYYLVKPFGFAQLRDQLEAYRRWRARLASAGEADQATVDTLYNLLRGSSSSTAVRRHLSLTTQRILDVIATAGQPVGAAHIAGQLGVSRPTVQRYLAKLERQGLIELHLEYGAAGRPNHLYRPAGGDG